MASADLMMLINRQMMKTYLMNRIDNHECEIRFRIDVCVI